MSRSSPEFRNIPLKAISVSAYGMAGQPDPASGIMWGVGAEGWFEYRLQDFASAACWAKSQSRTACPDGYIEKSLQWVGSALWTPTRTSALSSFTKSWMLAAPGCQPVKASRGSTFVFGSAAHRSRHVVEDVLCDPWQSRRIAACHGKTDQTFSQLLSVSRPASWFLIEHPTAVFHQLCRPYQANGTDHKVD